jgi:chromate transporter
MRLLILAAEFFKIGAFALGGGHATIPYLTDLARRYPWYTQGELLDMIAVSESTPGPIGINMATYAGFRAAGVPGGVAASLAIVAPAFLLVPLLAKTLDKLAGHRRAAAAFYGLRPAVAALVAYAALEFAGAVLLNPQFFVTGQLAHLCHWKPLLLAAASFAALRLFPKLPPLGLIGGAALAGMVLGMV